MNFSMLDFFKFASRMPQIAQIIVLTLKNFRTSLEISSFFFISNSRLCIIHVVIIMIFIIIVRITIYYPALNPQEWRLHLKKKMQLFQVGICF